MNKKILTILTGVSALVVAGLLSFIPASVSRAAGPSMGPAPVTYEIYITDRSNCVIPQSNTPAPSEAPAASPIYTTVPGTVNWTYSNIEPSNLTAPASQAFEFEIRRDGTQGVYAYTSFRNNNNSSACGTASFSFTYSGTQYAGTIDLFYAPCWQNAIEGEMEGFFEYIPPVNPAANEFYAAIDNTVNAIGLAIQGFNADGTVNETRTVEYKSSGAISPKIIYALAHAENVTLIYTFEYEGIIFQSAITSEAAAAMYSPTIPWYGPCYIATFCPPIPIGFVQ